MGVYAKHIARSASEAARSSESYIDPFQYRLVQKSETEFILQNKEDPDKSIDISIGRDDKGKVQYFGLPEQFRYYLGTFTDDEKLAKPLSIL